MAPNNKTKRTQCILGKKMKKQKEKNPKHLLQREVDFLGAV